MNQDYSTIVTLHNIDDEDFVFEYNRSEGNPAYSIPSGEVARYPKFLADHALQHLINKILTKRKVKTNNEPARMEVASQIVIGEESLRQSPTLTPTQKLQQDVEELNKTSTLDAILERRRKEKEAKVEPVKETVTTDRPEDVTEHFDGLEEKQNEVNQKLDEIKKAEESKVVPMPTKTALIEYAAQQGLVLDEANKEGKTLRQVYLKMNVADLVKELNYPLTNE